MHRSMHYVIWTRRSAVAALAMGLGLLLAPQSILADSHPHGGIAKRHLRELSAAWWQWAVSIPADVDPLVVADADSVDYCGVGQHGKVWFLGGSFTSGVAARECRIPAGNYIFFPILNSLCSTIRGRRHRARVAPMCGRIVG